MPDILVKRFTIRDFGYSCYRLSKDRVRIGLPDLPVPFYDDLDEKIAELDYVHKPRFTKQGNLVCSLRCDRSFESFNSLLEQLLKVIQNEIEPHSVAIRHASSARRKTPKQCRTNNQPLPQVAA